jgi:monomeric sarcosine oxidase
MGTATAAALGQRGVRALMIEQFDHIHTLGSHGGKTRIIRHAYAESPEYVPLVKRADELWTGLEQETETRLLQRTGVLELAAPGHQHARAARQSADEHDIPYEWLTPNEASTRWPVVKVPEDWDVLFSSAGGYLLTEPALSALAMRATRHGVDSCSNEIVQKWQATSTGVEVTTDKEIYKADRIIVTAGAWTARLLTDLGLPLTVLRKVLWWLAVNDEGAFAPERFPVFMSDSADGEIYGFPIAEHPGLKIANHAGGNQTTPETVDRQVRDEEKSDVVSLARRIFPSATDRVLESVVCLYTMTPDTDFILDRHPEWDTVVLGAGFSGHGFKFAPAIGEHLAMLALDERAQPMPRLALSRFPKGGSSPAAESER